MDVAADPGNEAMVDISVLSPDAPVDRLLLEAIEGWKPWVLEAPVGDTTPVVDIDVTDPGLIGLAGPPPDMLKSSIVVVLLAAELSRESIVSSDRLPGTMLRGIDSGSLEGRLPEMSFLMLAAATRSMCQRIGI